jgi:phosphoribosylanthranilate isomerase
LTRVKICGITGVAYARVSIDAGADLIGVVFAPSPRQITYEKAREITSLAKTSGVPVIGVFVNMPAVEVNEAASFCGLDMVQLSGDETTEYCRQIEKPVIRAVHIPRQWGETEFIDYLEKEERLFGDRSPIYLLDTMVENKYGGTGQVFNWDIAGRAAEKFRLIIAGGLTPENVGQLVTRLNPWGVDVSSGVETGGIKDINKIKAFIEAVKFQNKIVGLTTKEHGNAYSNEK